MAEKKNAERVVPDPVPHQNGAEHVDAVAAIRRGLAQAKLGLGRSVAEVFRDIRRQP
jgi:hypothetical protein